MNLCLFDLDHTLLPLDSDHAWGEFVVALGWADGPEQRRANDASMRSTRMARSTSRRTSSSPPAHGAGARPPSRRQPTIASCAS
ncbi:hypothetical protein Y694_03390 [Methylibium sp. T29-B]|nr:hypothetical protein Y694_03390 [Methylibium sp. T29-B]